MGAENAARAALVAALTVVGAAGITAIYTWRAAKLTEEGQITDRYTKAIEQLGSDASDVRIGAVHALERIARDSARDYPTVMEVLTAFIRDHSQQQWPLPEHEHHPARPRRRRPDVQAALSVIGRWRPIDLTDAVLTHAKLSHADLTGADLSGAKLTRVVLTGADLTGVWWPTDTPVPVAWKLVGSGQLVEARSNSGRAEEN